MREGAFVSLAGKGRVLALVFFIIVLAGCQQAPTGPQPLTDADKEQIAALNEAVVKALQTNDASAMAATAAGDAIFMPPNVEMVRGKVEIQQFYKTVFTESPLGGASLSPLDVFGEGRFAYETGTFTRTWTPPGRKEPVTEPGKYIFVLQRQADGTWKYTAAIWNVDQPLPAQGQGESASGN